jgi:quercetin dioxygenase-like cupin family protein
MRSKVRRLFFTALAGWCAVWSARYLAAQRGNSITVTRLYAGPNGGARAEKTALNLRSSSLHPGLDETARLQTSGAQFLRWPSGTVWEWHTASKRQYIITVSGRGEVEVSGGQKIPLNPGQILLAEDVTGKGHTTRVFGSEDLVLLLIPLAAQ